jgi:hypothetical protein
MRFKTTHNIFKDFGEHFDPNWMDSNKIITPPKKDWDYKRQMQIEDVNLWEVIYEQGGGFGIYAAWDPYAEFYMIRVGWFLEAQGYGAEIYYGPGSMNKMIKRAKELNIPISTNNVWIDPNDMWLYTEA